MRIISPLPPPPKIHIFFVVLGINFNNELYLIICEFEPYIEKCYISCKDIIFKSNMAIIHEY